MTEAESLWFLHMDSWLKLRMASPFPDDKTLGELNAEYKEWCAMTAPQRDKILFEAKMPKHVVQELTHRSMITFGIDV